MLLTVEKVIFLKSVEIFTDLPEESLIDVVSNLTEIEVSVGQVIFQKGEIGSSMYIIASGRVRLSDYDKTDVLLSERQIFGLLAALDPEPRVVSATAVLDSTLFKIDTKPLYDLIADNTEVAQSIIHFLCQRLRQKNR